jgi:cytidyltransferase-like protein
MLRMVLPQITSRSTGPAVTDTLKLILLFQSDTSVEYGQYFRIEHVAQYYGEMSSLVEREGQMIRFDPLIVLPSSANPPAANIGDISNQITRYRKFLGAEVIQSRVALFEGAVPAGVDEKSAAAIASSCAVEWAPERVWKTGRSDGNHLEEYMREIREAYPVPSSTEGNGWEKYDHVVLGGTFDRIHAGHKLMLTQMTMICKPDATVHVGVSGDPLLKNKQFKEMIKPLRDRMEDVRLLLQELKPGINTNVLFPAAPFFSLSFVIIV